MGLSRLFGSLFSLLVLLVANAGAAEPGKVRGEVIDIAAYAMRGDFARGDSHRAEGRKAAENGMPIGVLDDKTSSVYQVVTPDMKPTTQMLGPHMGDRVELDGKIMSIPGANLFVLESPLKVLETSHDEPTSGTKADNRTTAPH